MGFWGTPGASAEDIKTAYHRLAKKWHPDRFSGVEKAEAEKRFRLLAEAFSMLRDAGRREDAAKPAAVPPPPPSPAEMSIQLDRGPVVKTVPLHERTAADWYEEAKEAEAQGDDDKALGLIQYCIRMDATKAEPFVLLAKLLDRVEGGDKKALVKALENAVRLNPKDVDSTIRLAEIFQTVGMYARATRLWETARNLAPNHRHFREEQRKASAKAKAVEKAQSMGEQWVLLKEQGKTLIQRMLKRG